MVELNVQLIKNVFFSLGYAINLHSCGFVAVARVHLMLIFCFRKVQAKFIFSNFIYGQCILRIPEAAIVTTFSTSGKWG